MIRILTYSDPYQINKQKYWDEIKDCPWFCASQVMVNSLKDLYCGLLKEQQLFTVKKLTDCFFKKWDHISTDIEINAFFENYITRKELDSLEQERLRQLINSNRDALTDSLSLLIDLQVSPGDLKNCTDLDSGGQLLADMYEAFCSEKRFRDQLDAAFSVAEIQGGINELCGNTQPQTLVIVGVHQFSSLVIRTLKLLEPYYNFIFLFNYLREYSEIYKTWEKVYRQFAERIEFGTSVPVPAFSIKPGCRLAQRMGNICQGRFRAPDLLDSVDLIEFDNTFDFAYYVANCYSEGLNIDAHHPLREMPEKFYAGDMQVNEILRVYFPKQFNENNILQYPVGQFLVGLTNLWNANRQSLDFTQQEALSKVLGTGILSQSEPGELISVWNTLRPFVSHCADLSQVIERIKIIEDQRFDYDFEQHLAYFDLTDTQLNDFRSALEELQATAEDLFSGYGTNDIAFGPFCQKLIRFFTRKRDEGDRKEAGTKTAVDRAIDNLKQLENMDVVSTFACLQRTLDLLLGEAFSDSASSNWIVKGIAQIEGDILRSKSDPEDTIYHFACLSDGNMVCDHPILPWPLTEDILRQVVQDRRAADLLLESAKERNNYNQFALFFGLYFNRRGFKLSYVKHEGTDEQRPFYLFELLKTRTIPYCVHRRKTELPESLPYLTKEANPSKLMNLEDYYRYVVCPYRFLLGTGIDGTFKYRDEFTDNRFMETVGAFLNERRQPRKKRMRLGGQSQILNTFNQIEEYFPQVYAIQKADLEQGALILSKSKIEGKFPNLRNLMKEGMLPLVSDLDRRQKEQLEDVDDYLAAQLLEEKDQQEHFNPRPSARSCMYCPYKEICLAYYK